MFLSLWERLGEGAQHRAGIEIGFNSQRATSTVAFLMARPKAYESERRRRKIIARGERSVTGGS
jgi:hypothetical protein